MSSKRLLIAIFSAVCIAQLVHTTWSQHVVEGGGRLDNLVKLVSKKINSGVHKIEHLVNKAINKVNKYKEKLEGKALEVASRELGKQGMKVNLRQLYQELKSNASICAKETNLKSKAMLIVTSSLSCIAGRAGDLVFMVQSLKGIWNHGKKVVSAVQDVASNCTLQTQKDPNAFEESVELDVNEEVITDEEVAALEKEEITSEEVDSGEYDIVHSSEVAQIPINYTEPHRPLRVLWENGKRIAHCVKSMYRAAKGDLKKIVKLITSLVVRAAVMVEFVEAEIAVCIALQVGHFLKLNFNLGECMSKKMFSFGKK